MQYFTELLQKIAQLILIRENEPLVNAFFDFMFGQFENLDGIALYKLEHMEKEVSLSVDAFQSKVSDDFFNQKLSEFLQQCILENTELEDSLHTVSDHNVLIIKANRDKQIVYYLVYQFSNAINCEQQIGFIPSALLGKDNDTVQTQMIRHLSQIYSNHQSLILLNDKDSLTGLFNRKSFDRQMNRFLEAGAHPQRRHKESEANAYLAILDIDHFKKINDTYGHLYGDEVLLHFAQQMQKFFRENDLLFRYGGEEFIVILSDIEQDMAEQVLHRFRRHIEAYDFPQVSQVTVSIGMTQLEKNRMQNEIVDRADHALYYTKEHGRNNVGCYETLVNKGILKELVTEDDIELF